MKETYPEVVQDLIQRMRKIEGQARGIQRMLGSRSISVDVVGTTVYRVLIGAALGYLYGRFIGCAGGSLMQSKPCPSYDTGTPVCPLFFS